MRGTGGERKTKGEKSKNVKQEERRRAQKRALRSQYHLRLYAAFAATRRYIFPFRRLPFVYFFSFSRMSILLPFPRFSVPCLRHRSPSRRMFVPTMLYHPAIISHTCHSPSVSPLPPSVIPPTLAHHPSPLTALSRGLL